MLSEKCLTSEKYRSPRNLEIGVRQQSCVSPAILVHLRPTCWQLDAVILIRELRGLQLPSLSGTELNGFAPVLTMRCEDGLAPKRLRPKRTHLYSAVGEWFAKQSRRLEPARPDFKDWW